MAAQPNILVFLADSTQVTHLGCYGDAHSVTPNLDRMAAEGICFRNMFATTPLCHPARGALLTGLYPHANGSVCNAIPATDSPVVNPALPTLYSVLHDAGYRCGKVTQGVHAKGTAEARGLDDIVGAYTLYREERARLGKNTEPLGELGDAIEGKPLDVLEDLRDIHYFRHGMRMLETFQRESRPWALTFEFDGPHPPCLPPRKYWEAIDLDSIQLPPGLHDPLTDRNPRHRQLRTERRYDTWSDTRWREAIRLYRAMISLHDDFIGQILRSVDDNTLVIVTSDHGELIGRHGIWSKYPSMDDAITHIPLVMRWPKGIRPGRIERSFVSSTDILPTICDIAGVETPAFHHGRSLNPFFQGERPADWRNGIVTTFDGVKSDEWVPMRAYRDERYKYMYDPRGIDEFYDIQNDAWERRNLIEDPQYQPLIKQYAKTLALELQRIGDSMAEMILSDKTLFLV